MLGRSWILLLLILPWTFLLGRGGLGTPGFALADDVDVAEGEDEEEIQVESEPETTPETEDSVIPTGEETEEEEEAQLKPSPDADTFFLFTKPSRATLELPAGRDVQFLVGFTNKGEKEFVLETMDASFRYSMDFSFYIQNFTTLSYNRPVKPKQQVTLYYSFYTSESFSARPFGLTVNLLYRDVDGNQYLDAVFNETVSIIEIDEGLDGETFFLYLFLAAFGVLLLVGGQHFLATYLKRPMQKPKIEMGTQNANDVDYDWLPKNTLNELNKSPRRSPRLRKLKRGTGSGED
ncbi:translocon-associated protein subunit alpha-like isoform X2 [Centruroides vittatus]|uniref:translocon-associated protein subunit alpha-like isoform X2 n=1 Tax=Centruroides vittatus TaxID=120091 RepID=UPI00350FC399